MKRKIIALCLIVAMLGVAVIGGTMAYFTDTAEAVNVMTIGSVKIEQIEQERNAAGELVPFTQAKQAIPAVFANGTGTIKWDDTKLDFNGKEYKVFDDSMKNVIDKFVTVKNTGKSDAYFRTIIAIEVPDLKFDNLLHTNVNTSDYKMCSVGTWNLLDADGKTLLVPINGTNYLIKTLVYTEALAPGKTSGPSFLQTFINPKAEQEDVAAIGDTWEILAISQAIQASGFDDPNVALDEGFGEINVANVQKWFGELEVPTVVETADELKAAIANGGSILLGADIDDWDADATVTVPAGKEVTLDLNGNTITAEAGGTGNREIFLVKGEMTVKNGDINLAATVNQGWGAMATVFDVTAGGVLNLEGVDLKVGGTDMTFGVHLNNWGEVTLNMNDCTIETNYVAVRAFNSGNDMNNVTITKSTLKGNYGFWVHNYTLEDFGTQEKVDAHKALLNLDIFNGTNTFDTATAAARYGFTNSIKLDANGNEIK